jgi:hypothetical protein
LRFGFLAAAYLALAFLVAIVLGGRHGSLCQELAAGIRGGAALRERRYHSR